MTVVGGLMYVALLALGVPFAVALAVIVAFGEIIPQIGVWIGRVPLLGVAALQGWQTFVLTLLVSVVLENLKAFVISPRVEGEQLKIDPLLVLIAVLVGGTLLGAGGALIAVPFAAMLQVLFDEVFVPWRLERSRTLPRTRRPHRRTQLVLPIAADGHLSAVSSYQPDLLQSRCTEPLAAAKALQLVVDGSCRLGRERAVPAVQACVTPSVTAARRVGVSTFSPDWRGGFPICERTMAEEWSGSSDCRRSSMRGSAN